MYNKVILIGNLTRDIEIQYLQGSNTPLAKGGVATSYKYKGNDGTQKEETCFLDFNIFGRVAEVANQYLHKGSKVMLEGRLVFDQWQDSQTGQNRSKHSLKVDNMKMLDSKSNTSSSTQTDSIDTYRTTSQNVNRSNIHSSNQVPKPIIDVNEIPDDPNDWNKSVIDIQNDEITF